MSEHAPRPGTLRILSNGRTRDSHVQCMGRDGEWIEVTGVTQITIDPINTMPLLVFATIRVLDVGLNVSVLPEQFRANLHDMEGKPVAATAPG